MSERCDEMSCAVEEGDMIRMAGDARLVEGYEDIDGRNRLLVALCLHMIRKIWGKGRGKDSRDSRLVPRG